MQGAHEPVGVRLSVSLTVVTLLAAAAPGCSFVFVSAPPAASRPDEIVDCSESSLAATIDAAIAVPAAAFCLVSKTSQCRESHARAEKRWGQGESCRDEARTLACRGGLSCQDGRCVNTDPAPGEENHVCRDLDITPTESPLFCVDGRCVPR